MNGLTIKQTRPNIKPSACPISLNWKDNPDIQKLLDVISEIIANEYIEVTKQNPEVFSSHPTPLSIGEREITGGKNESSNIR